MKTILDYKTTEIGKQNWEVCARMLMHDLLDISEDVPELAAILKHYDVSYTEDGGYTMSLPRMGALLGHRSDTLANKMRCLKRHK